MINQSKTLDYESISNFNCTLRATDGGETGRERERKIERDVAMLDLVYKYIDLYYCLNTILHILGISIAN